MSETMWSIMKIFLTCYICMVYFIAQINLEYSHWTVKFIILCFLLADLLADDTVLILCMIVWYFSSLFIQILATYFIRYISKYSSSLCDHCIIVINLLFLSSAINCQSHCWVYLLLTLICFIQGFAYLFP